MNTLVTYVSATGNTRKVAEAIHEVLPEEKTIVELAEVTDLEGFDLVFLGFPIFASGPNPAARDFLAANAEGKKLALFITHAAPEDSEDVEEWLGKCREAASGADLVGFFDCQGELAPAVAEMLLKSDDPKLRGFGEQAGSTVGQPDESRLQRAREFAKKVLEDLHGTKATGCA
ncbi:MAG: flavodoxin family protein [Candidatus Geothermincolia bacterium]